MTNTQLLKIYYLETKTEWLKIIRMPSFAIPSLLFPLMFYIVFGLLLKQQSMASQIASYLLATYGSFGVMGPALFSFGVGIAVEKQQGLLDLKQASPMPASALIISRVCATLLFSSIIVIGLFLLAAVFGDVRLYFNQWLLLATTLLIGSIPFCVLGLWIGLSIKAQGAPAIVNLIYLPMSLLSGLWVPIHFFPSVMQNFANVLPSYHLAQLSLKVLELDQGQSLIFHLAILLIELIILTALAMFAYKHMKN